MTRPRPGSATNPAVSPLRFVVLFGVVSLLADAVYESARSITGPFLATLGATAVVVGVVSGLGEFVGYALRLAFGYAAERTGRYWSWTIAGYGLTVVAVPLIGLATSVPVAIALIFAERLGKAVRSPAKDTLLSFAGHAIGRGKSFGIHEFLDQIGAVAGPLLLSAVLSARAGDYRLAFGVLAVPGLGVLLMLVVLRSRVPDPAGFEPPLASGSTPASRPEPGARALPAMFWRYGGFVTASLLGLAPFPLIAFHLTTRGVVADATVPLFFAAAMAVDAVIALGAGAIYDRRGLVSLWVVPAATTASLLAFAGDRWLALVGITMWGVVVGVQESTLRAAVADLVPIGRRASSYGWFNALYGVGLLAGGALLGWAYQRSIALLVVIAVIAQIAAAGQLAGLLRGTSGLRGNELN